MKDSPLRPRKSARQLAEFRNLKAPTEIAPAERLLIGILGFHLALLPWPLATMHALPQVLSLMASIVGFSIAVPGKSAKLFSFPIFWLGGILVAYVVVQGLNPDWQYFSNGHFWWLAAKSGVSWLPTSVEAPFRDMNAWRMAIVYSDSWLLVCSVWVGITRRKSIRLLFGVVVMNCLLLTGLLAVQRNATGPRFPWPLTSWTPYDLAGTFISRNHAAAYLALGVYCAAALGIWNLEQAERHHKKSNPAGVFAIAAIVLAGGVLFTLSRGAVVTMALAGGMLGLWLFVRRTYRSRESENWRAGVAIAAIFALFLVGSLRYLDFTPLESRFDQFAAAKVDPSVLYRTEARHAAAQMLKDEWLRGVGAGGFRFLFVPYVRRFPDIYQGGKLFWEHAHCDWLEIPIELGIGGTLLLVASAAWFSHHFAKYRFWKAALATPLLLGCMQTLVHAGFDFPFQCPAIIATWCFMLIAAAKWLTIGEILIKN